MPEEQRRETEAERTVVLPVHSGEQPGTSIPPAGTDQPAEPDKSARSAQRPDPDSTADQPTERTLVVPVTSQPVSSAETTAEVRREADEESTARQSPVVAWPPDLPTEVAEPALSESERTVVIPSVGAAAPPAAPAAPTSPAPATPMPPPGVPTVPVGSGSDAPTMVSSTAPTALLTRPAPMPQQDEPGMPGEPGPDEARRRQLKKAGVVAGAVAGALGLIYGLDLALSQGTVPRGIAVAGVDVGGMDRSAAEQKLRDEIGPRLDQPVELQAGDVPTTLDPKAAGLRMDWQRTLDEAGEQPLNPVTRLTSFFTTREIGVVSDADREQVARTLDELRKQTDREPVEGTIRFEGATPVPVDPKPGQKLNVPEAIDTLLTEWASGKAVHLPISTVDVRTTKEDVQRALDEVAKPAVSGPVTIKGDGKDGVLEPKDIAAALSFVPAKNGGLEPKLDTKKLAEVLKPQLASTEEKGEDARIVIEGDKPVVKPSKDGRGIDYDKTFEPLPDVLKRTDNRELKAEYADQPAKLTTEQAQKLGVKEVVAEFTTGGFAPDSGHNIRLAAESLNGAIIKPGETFSMNKHTGPRTVAQGYIPAGIINNGKPDTAVGGGVSQMATTLYNASYFAGMTDMGHTPHSYWISRYPKGREATIFQNPDGSSVIDLRFRNDSKTGLMIQTIWTPSSITVRMWGTKTYEVTSDISDEYNHTPPPEKKVKGDKCHASNGSRGFTVTDTRTIKDLDGRVIKREKKTVRYDGSPKIICEG
ncbi:hypothetical protein GCM10012275_18430 [Longimycelium tulufanense]|uniref:YoaR-like putative peptidoglycan binding domain-containing protein n=1 Tax=Longimycelium tulufanense TaxID=907463 RepID=A0A8J3FVU8_9PSEU|nr:VanW family protein [Longimycelium tulufanense]GGM47686.1 hypothetical protein GCM10012275_18430 [Longimycelium tulufanense]